MLSDVNLVYAFAFLLLGVSIIGGLLLQALAIVRQQKSFLGLFLKFGSVMALLALITQVRQNIVPYLVVFVMSALFSLIAATLARRVLLR